MYMKVIVRPEGLLKRRLELGLSQNALATASGLSNPFLNQLERQKRFAGPESVKRLCDVLGVTFDEIFTVVNVERRGGKK